MFKKLKSAFLWTTESTVRTFVGLLVLSLIVNVGVKLAHAATSYNVSNEAQMFLDVSINASQTTGIIVSAPQVNGTTFTFSTTTGGLLRLRYGQYREDIYYSSASVDATTKKITLSGVIRNICPQYGTQYISCGNGRSWAKGAITELTVDARLINLKANVDRTNTFTAPQTFGSGITLTGVDEAFRLTQVTTAQRDAIASPENGMMVYNTTTGVINQYIAGSWEAIGTTGVSNASETAAGKVELATIKEMTGATIVGSTGAPVVIQARYTAFSGSTTTDNSAKKGYVVLLNSTGAVDVSLGGIGRTNPGSGGVLIGQGTEKVRVASPTQPNQILLSTDGRNPMWGTSVAPTTAVLNISTPVYRNDNGTLTGSLINYTITGGTITSAGRTFLIRASGTGSGGGGGAARLYLQVGTGVTLLLSGAPVSGTWDMAARLTFVSTGTNAKYTLWAQAIGLAGTTLTQSAVTTAAVKFVPSTSSDIPVRVFMARTGGGTADAVIYYGVVERIN